MGEAEKLTLHVEDWGAVHAGGGISGNVADVEAIPSAFRRRLAPFMRSAIRVMLNVMTPESELVFASQYGDMPTTAAILKAIAEKDLVSPTAFSASVHNAAPALSLQLLGVRQSHTAIAAGDASLRAGLTESYLRLASGDAANVALIFCDAPLPPPYEMYEEEPSEPEIFMGVRLALAATGEPGMTVGPGRAGALALAAALEKGARLIAAPRAP
jgi:hypothetical protein